MNITGRIKPNDSFFVFITALIARLLWATFSGLGPEDAADFLRYDEFSDNIIGSQFNLETKLFILAPLFPYFLALIKIIFSSHWITGIAIIQVLISAISVVYFYKSADLIFRSRSISLTAGLGYALYLPTIYYVHLPSQESLFQSFFVISFYYLCAYNFKPNLGSLTKFSIFYSLALLTKSHIILMVPFVLLIIAAAKRNIIKILSNSIVFLALVFTISLPYGIYNLRANGVYVISSSGFGGFFLTGHNDDFYTWAINTPQKGTQEYGRLLRREYPILEITEVSENTTHKQLQAIYFQRGVKWIKENPVKTINLLKQNVWNHLRPGYALKYHSLKNWIIALIFNLPIYILGYIELLKGLRHPKPHLPAYSVFLMMMLFVLVFYAQNRFRLITIEPIYLLYASPGIASFVKAVLKHPRLACYHNLYAKGPNHL